MDLNVFQRTIVDETGDTLPSAQIDVYLADTTTRPDLFSDKEGLDYHKTNGENRSYNNLFSIVIFEN